MNEFIEKLIGRLEECEKEYTSEYGMIDIHIREVFVKIRKIVNQLAEEHKEKLIVDGQYCWQTCSATEHCKECNRLCNGSIDYYENYDFMAEKHRGGWIPCSERLPDIGERVFVWVYGRVCIGKRIDAKLFEEYDIFSLENGSNESTKRIDAWQPLPAPYQPKGE